MRWVIYFDATDQFFSQFQAGELARAVETDVAQPPRFAVLIARPG